MDNRAPFLFATFADDDMLHLRAHACNRSNLSGSFYTELCAYAQARGLGGNLWHAYLADRLLTDANLFARAASLWGNGADAHLQSLAGDELSQLATLFHLPMPEAPPALHALIDDFHPPQKTAPYSAFYQQNLEACIKLMLAGDGQAALAFLLRFHYLWGYGDACRFNFFIWQDGGLRGVIRADAIELDDLIAYERQKQKVLENTKAFLRGAKANNMFLYGERGTGKSSLVKAVGNHYAPQGLKMVTLPRHQLAELGALLDYLDQLNQKYIVFLDDLSFDKEEKEYKYLKTLMEGGLSALPENVLLYATSNRRHLVAETWADRSTKDEAMYLNDIVSEKLSLSERFGIMVTFPAPNQNEYLEIVTAIAQKEGIELDHEQLCREAIAWERQQHTRSGRTARQFVNHLLSQKEILE